MKSAWRPFDEQHLTTQALRWVFLAATPSRTVAKAKRISSRAIRGKPFNNRGRGTASALDVFSRLTFFMLLFFDLCSGATAETVRVEGVIERCHYNPEKGYEYTDAYKAITFQVLLCQNPWQLSGTNVSEPWLWLVMGWDGTNTYVLFPSSLDRGLPPPGPSPRRGMVYASPLYLLYYSMNYNLPLYPAWIAYCLRPETLPPGPQGRRIAPPIVSGRGGVISSRWDLTFANDQPFVEHLYFVRDHSLDQPVSSELLQDHFEPPDDLASYNSYLQGLMYRRGIANGFVSAEFHCTERFLTNGWNLAIRCEAARYTHTLPGKPDQRLFLIATNIQRSASCFDPIPRPTQPTEVWDYRYRRLERKRLFLYAVYTLQPGEAWRGAQDPELLAQVERFIRHGPRYDAFCGLPGGIT